MNVNIFPPQFSIDEKINNQEYYDQNPFSCDRVFYNSTTQDHATRYYHQQLCQLPTQYDHIQEDHDAYGYDEGKVESGFKLSVWKKEDDGIDELCGSSKNVVKWMPSNIRVKKADRDMSSTVDVTLKINCSSSLNNQKLNPSSSTLENVSSNNISYNTPIRVCSDCNTTKTPLWRSGPKGPKSLCNACGIRQRKARRAMAAAAAATSDEPPPVKIIKVQQHKEKNIISKKGHSSKFKKRCKMSANASGSSPSNGQKKLNLEDFLINLSKNLAFQRVFPEDEKDAAILLMALSSGLVHG